LKTVVIAALLSATVSSFTLPAYSADLIGFWDTQRKGGNSFNKTPPDEAYFKTLAATGATWVRLTFSKWRGEDRDFLIGNADHYRSLREKDLQILRKTLDAAQAAGLKVVLTSVSLPGARWTQQNGGKFDDRLWESPEYVEQAVKFWTDLAGELKDHPAIAAYNLINEPAPEKTTGLKENASMEVLEEWQKEHQNGTRDLRAFYQQLIEGIWKVDPATPIMVDSGYYANARSLAAWPAPLADTKVLYAFHMYEPYDATSAPNMKRKVPLRYPGVKTRYSGSEVIWDRKTVAAHITLPFEWARKNGLSTNRIVMAEFGCMRLWPDCSAYLTDVMDAAEKFQAHRAFYAFREDEWDGMDYELPASLRPGQFYWLTEQGKQNKIPRNGELMKLLKKRM
ncbi:TPA: glycoside hydrolase family 5 protein, partial [Klebsiella pneumoniae]